MLSSDSYTVLHSQCTAHMITDGPQNSTIDGRQPLQCIPTLAQGLYMLLSERCGTLHRACTNYMITEGQHCKYMQAPQHEIGQQWTLVLHKITQKKYLYIFLIVAVSMYRCMNVWIDICY